MIAFVLLVAAFATLALVSALWLPRVLGGAPSNDGGEAGAAWGVQGVATVLLSGFALLIVVGAGLARLGSSGFLVELLASQGALAATAGLAVLHAVREDPNAARSLGFHALGGAVSPMGSPRWSGLVWCGRALLAYVLAWPSLVTVQGAWNLMGPRLGLDLEPQAVLVGILELRRGVLLLACACAVVIGPFVEELLFRGFVQPALVKRSGSPFLGIAATSILFASLHGIAAFPQIFLLSLLLGWIRHRTGSTLLAWGIHALHNGLHLILAFMVPVLTEGLPSSP